MSMSHRSLSGRFNWWLCVVLIASQPDRRPHWVELRYGCLARSRPGVFSLAGYIEELACFTLSMQRAGRPGRCFSFASDSVSACLEAIAISPEQAANRDCGGQPGQPRPSALALPMYVRNLITARQWDLDTFTDRHLAGQLQHWIDLKQRLA